jgi:hypothetical protein
MAKRGADVAAVAVGANAERRLRRAGGLDAGRRAPFRLGYGGCGGCGRGDDQGGRKECREPRPMMP